MGRLRRGKQEKLRGLAAYIQNTLYEILRELIIVLKQKLNT